MNLFLLLLIYILFCWWHVDQEDKESLWHNNLYMCVCVCLLTQTSILPDWQQTSGADLALLMLDVLEKSRTEPTEENITRIARWEEA